MYPNSSHPQIMKDLPVYWLFIPIKLSKPIY
jgi:hypothetical protein